MHEVVNLDVFGFWVDKEKEADEEANRYSKSKPDNPEETAQQPHLGALGRKRRRRRRNEWWWKRADEKNPRKWFKSLGGKREKLEGCDVCERDYEWKRQKTETLHHPLCFHFNAIQYNVPCFWLCLCNNEAKITPFFCSPTILCGIHSTISLISNYINYYLLLWKSSVF